MNDCYHQNNDYTKHVLYSLQLREKQLLEYKNLLGEKDRLIEYLKNKLQKTQYQLDQSNIKINQLQAQIASNCEFRNYFENKENSSPIPERFGTPLNYKNKEELKLISQIIQIRPLSPITSQLQVVNDLDFKSLPYDQITKLTLMNPKTKSSMSNSALKTTSRLSQLPTQKPPQKFIIDNNDLNVDDNNLSKPQNQANNDTKLYSEFLFIGVQQSQIIKEIESYQGLTSFNIPSKIIYNFSASKSIFQKIGPLKNSSISINQLIFPYDINIQKLSFADQYSQINAILFSNFNIDNNPNCFVIALNDLYYVCVKFNDYLDISKYFKANSIDPQIWAHSRAICISTKLPYVNFFFELIISFLNEIKFQRLQKYTKNNDFSCVDSDYFEGYFNEQLANTLTRLALHQIPQPNRKYQIEFYRATVNLQLDSAELMKNNEIHWAITYLLNIFTPIQIINLFFSTLLERSLVFASMQMHVLQCAIITFHKLIIDPLKWVHPLIPSIPQQSADILFSPVPIIAGLIKDKQQIEKFAHQHKDLIFIYMDEQVEFMNGENIPLISSQMLKSLKNQIIPFYDSLIDSTPQRSLRASNNCPLKSKSSVCNGVQTLDSSKKILKLQIISKLPKTPIYSEQKGKKKLLNYEKIGQQCKERLFSKQDQDFWNKFIKTQIFTYYLETFYQ